MANTKISDLYSTFVINKGNRWLMYGQFEMYGDALNYCIKKDLPIKNIYPVYNICSLNSIDYYTVKGEEPPKMYLGHWFES